MENDKMKNKSILVDDDLWKLFRKKIKADGRIKDNVIDELIKGYVKGK